MPEETGIATEAESTQEPSQALGERIEEHPKAAPDSEGNGQEAAQSNGQKPKGLSRYERTKRERAEFNRQREAFARERAEFEARQKPKRDYTVEDLKKYRAQWEEEGNLDLVERADKEIAAMEAEAQSTGQLERFKSEWETAERELAQVD